MADIRAADAAIAAETRAAEEQRQASLAQQRDTSGWKAETDQERAARRRADKARQKRLEDLKRTAPDRVLIDTHVTPEAQRHGLYVPDTVPGPPITKKGKELPTSTAVVRNRGGTAVERWHAHGDLDRRQIEAIAVYQRAHSLYYGEQRVTANWSMVSSIRGGGATLEQHVANQLAAKQLLRHFDNAIFFAMPLRYMEVWSNVVIFDEPTGTAGGRLGFKSKQAEAAAKAIVILIADMIATDQRLGNR